MWGHEDMPRLSRRQALRLGGGAAALLAVAFGGNPARAQAVSQPGSGAALTDPVARFFDARGGAAAFVSPTGFTPAGQALIARLRRAAEDGLDPAYYAIPDPAAAFADADAARRADWALARAAASFIADLAGGRVRSLPNRPDILRAPLTFDMAEALGRIAASADPAMAVDGFQPTDAAYRALRAELARLRSQTMAGATEIRRIPAGPTIDPGQRNPRVAILRERLAAAGFQLASAEASDHYDPDLVAAVKRFQAQNGLNADGRLGRGTVQALNEGPSDRINQIRVAMDMRRSLVPDEAVSVEVNVPEYRLRVTESGRVTLDMAVVVGRPGRATPMLRTRLTHALFNPPWGVPEKLAREDLLPRFRRDPQAMAERGFRVFQRVEGQVVEVDPRTVDWTQVNQRAFPYYVRQNPGAANALGRLRLTMPNRDDIFMHDTPDRHYFRREMRAYSSGCIRLEKPIELTAFLLASNPGWGRERIEAAIERRGTAGVPAQRTIQTVIAYRTVVVGADGRVTYWRDIYNLDHAYLRAMDAQRRPVGAETQLAAR
ncbi:MAG: L,D-transpeptidase family protein [Alphaproteobacteria bacterium]|nr:L,D-transpeptidase family protein [Alphaproteobacteria bacterium]